MGPRQTSRKLKKQNKRVNTKTRSKRHKGSGVAPSRLRRPRNYVVEEEDPNTIEEEDTNTIEDYLGLAIQEETPTRVRSYLNQGANPNITILDQHEYLQQPQEVPAIIYAARHIKPSTILKYLLDNGADIEQTYDTRTPLIEAVEWGNLSAVTLLLERNANINAKTSTGIPAIAYAVMNEDIPMIKLILDKRKGEIELNYTVFGEPSGIMDDIDKTNNTDISKIFKEYIDFKDIDVPILSEEEFKLCEASPGKPPKCGISLDELKRHETVKLPGKNNVCYHRSHIQKWLRQKKTNPVTKEHIPDEWILENYPHGLEYNYQVTLGGNRNRKQTKRNRKQTKALQNKPHRKTKTR